MILKFAKAKRTLKRIEGEAMSPVSIRRNHSGFKA
jgi:hypothetical protein